jgi:Reverse transcriptase (RNA-dependent DNA polymerase)
MDALVPVISTPITSQSRQRCFTMAAPKGGMPQGSYYGPYVFLIMINELTTNVPLIKFVDDVTAVEIISPGACSHMQTVLDQITHWSDANFIEINSKKSKHMFFWDSELKDSTNATGIR